MISPVYFLGYIHVCNNICYSCATEFLGGGITMQSDDTGNGIIKKSPQLYFQAQAFDFIYFVLNAVIKIDPP